MKNILFTTAGMALCLGLASCNNANEADNARFNTRVDSTVNVRLTTLRDSMTMVCDSMILSAARAKADSILALSGKSTGKPRTNPTTTPTPKPTDPKDKKLQGDTEVKKEEKMQGDTKTKKEDKMNRGK